MPKYLAVMEFEGGCRNCPFCVKEKCVAQEGKHIEWHYGVNTKTKEVEIIFDPWQDIDLSCPLTPVNDKKKKKGKKHG